jgi:methylated-DNA-protein-cysteine methyltransferase related protein
LRIVVSRASIGDSDEYAAAVFALARQIPVGRAMSYGLIAEIVAEELHRGGPRQVGQVMSGLADRYRHLVPGDAPAIGPAQDNYDVPWWRVVYADGRPPAMYANSAIAAWRRENTPLLKSGERIDLAKAIWYPGIDDSRGGSY